MRKICIASLIISLCLCLMACVPQNTAPVAVDESIERISGHMGAGMAGSAFSYQEISDKADIVVVADISRVTQDSGIVYAVCHPIKTIKGDVVEEFFVRDSGTTDKQEYEGRGNPSDVSEVRREYTYVGEPLMRSGNRVLLFLTDNGKTTESGTAYYDLTLGPVSKFFFDPEDNCYHNALLYSDVYRDFISQNPHVPFVENVLTDMTPKPLEELEALMIAS